MASGAAKRYAQAVLSLAKERGTLDDWLRDLSAMNDLLEEPRVAQYFATPGVATAEKRQVLDNSLRGAQSEARNLARILAERNRLGVIPDIYRLYVEGRLAELGIAIADVTTADPMTVREQAVVEARLRQIVGKNVQLRLHTDPAIIGGVVARVGDMLIDGSVVTRLRRLRARLANVES